MKSMLAMCVLSTFVLSACVEESAPPVTPQNDPVTPVINPEPLVPQPVVPEPVTPEPVVYEPVVPQPVVPEPVTPQPIIPQPVTPTPVIVEPEPVGPEPVAPGSVGEALINGANLQSINSFWYCDDSSGVDSPIEFSFFADGHVFLAGEDLVEIMDWEVEGLSVNLFYQSQFLVQLNDFEWSADSQQFTSTYAFYEGSTGSLDCKKVFFEDESPAIDSKLYQVIESGDKRESEQSNILNSLKGDEFADQWVCQSASGDELRFTFGGEYRGTVQEAGRYPEGLEFVWSLDDDDLLMTLLDGNEIRASNVVTGADYLDSDSLMLNGGDAGAMACEKELVS